MTGKERSSLQDCKIDVYEDSIAALPDKIENQAAWLKKMFDARTDKEVKELHNALVDYLIQKGADDLVSSEDIQKLRAGENNRLEVSKNGKEWEVIGSGGHIVEGPDGELMPQRTKLAFRGQVEVEDYLSEDATVVYGLKGEPGNTGVVTELSRGLFMLSVGEDGNLYLTHNDNEAAPPLSIEDGQLVYTIEE